MHILVFVGTFISNHQKIIIFFFQKYLWLRNFYLGIVHGFRIGTQIVLPKILERNNGAQAYGPGGLPHTRGWVPLHDYLVVLKRLQYCNW